MNHSELQLEKVKNTLVSVLNLLPDQFALQEVRINLQKTLKSINEVQNKRTQRKNRQLQQEKSNILGFLNMDDAKKALDILDKMMREEESKINQKPKTQGKNINDGLFLG